MNTDWGDDDVIDTEPLPQYDLPRNLAELRDGIAPPLPQQGQARARRIEQLQHDVASCQALVEDLDRWLAGDPCVGELVPILMRNHAERLRREAVAKGRVLHEELQWKRSQP